MPRKSPASARRQKLKDRVRAALASRGPDDRLTDHWCKYRFPWEAPDQVRRLAAEVRAEAAAARQAGERLALKGEVRAVVADLVDRGIEPTGSRLQKAFPGRGNYSLCEIRDELAEEGLVDWEPAERPEVARGLSGATDDERRIIWERARRLREGRDLDTGEPVGPPRRDAGKPLTLAEQLRRMNLHKDPRPAGEREVSRG